MVKYSDALKRQLIQDYLDGLGSYKKLAQKYGLPTKSIILQWLNVYEYYGFEGLEGKRILPCLIVKLFHTVFPNNRVLNLL